MHQVLIYLCLFLIYVFVLISNSLYLAVFVHLLSRFTYFAFVFRSLKLQEGEQYFTKTYGLKRGFGFFRSTASLFMKNDAFTFVLLCWITRESYTSSTLAFGILFIVVGAAIKIWARLTIGEGYYWKDFFVPLQAYQLKSDGPYRFLKNPMYTVGYLPAYGLSLCLRSRVGLLCAALDQAFILTLYWVVEKGHYQGLLKTKE